MLGHALSFISWIQLVFPPYLCCDSIIFPLLVINWWNQASLRPFPGRGHAAPRHPPSRESPAALPSPSRRPVEEKAVVSIGQMLRSKNAWPRYLICTRSVTPQELSTCLPWAVTVWRPCLNHWTFDMNDGNLDDIYRVPIGCLNIKTTFSTIAILGAFLLPFHLPSLVQPASTPSPLCCVTVPEPERVSLPNICAATIAHHHRVPAQSVVCRCGRRRCAPTR